MENILYYNQNINLILIIKKIEFATKELDSKEVTYRARIHNTRKQKGVFVVLRQGCYTIQACFFEDGEMLKFIKEQTKESVVDVTGIIKVAKDSITSTSQKDVELQITKFFTVVSAISPLPLQIEDSMIAEEEEEKKEEKKEEKEGRK